MGNYQREEIKCGICGDTGWQELRIPGASNTPNVFARPCACSVLPADLRSARPFCEPDWVRDKMGVWSPNPEAEMQPRYQPAKNATDKGYVVWERKEMK